MLKRLGGTAVRRLAPRSIEALEEVVRLREELDDLRRRHAALEELVHGGLAELRASVAETRTSVTEVDGGLQESRALSLRVGQLTDLVFARLADAGTAGSAR